eukprot:8362007-Alexandrium_andersonii.AAC.1
MLHAAGMEADDRCKWCGCDVRGSMLHLWWECQRFSESRQQVWSGQVPDYRALPPLLARTGCAPALIPSDQGMRWGELPGDGGGDEG